MLLVVIVLVAFLWIAIWLGAMFGFWKLPGKNDGEMHRIRTSFWELFILKVPKDDDWEE